MLMLDCVGGEVAVTVNQGKRQHKAIRLIFENFELGRLSINAHIANRCYLYVCIYFQPVIATHWSV